MTDLLKTHRTISLAIVLGAIAVMAPLLAPNDYVVGVLARICLYATLALGLNVVVGFAGLLDIGYVAFFGIGSLLFPFLPPPPFCLRSPVFFCPPSALPGP